MKGDEKRVVLKSLQPDTRYSILVSAEYRSREGGSGSAQGKTSESKQNAVWIRKSSSNVKR